MDIVWILSGIILLLLVLSAFFSASETALTAASRPRFHQLEKEGSRSAAKVNQLRSKSKELIGAILLGNNLVNISASALATSVFIQWFGQAGIAYATAVMTLLVLIFSEVLPKTLAINNPDRLAVAVAPLMSVIVKLFLPVTKVINFIITAVLWILGIKMSTDLGQALSDEELRGAIELHQGPDEEEGRRRQVMLHSILDLAEVEISEIMIHRKNVVVIDADQSASKIVEQVLASPFTRLPLWRKEPDNIVGVLHAKALLRAVQAHQGDLDSLDISGVMVSPWFIPETTALLDQLQAFRQRREHFALVVDEYGTLMGVVTLEDILEEIVGEISDEHDVSVSGVRIQVDGSYIIDGTVTIRDLDREFGWDLPDEEAATLAGLILHEARQIPSPGQVFTFYGFRFEILRRQRNQITSVRVIPPITTVQGAA